MRRYPPFIAAVLTVCHEEPELRPPPLAVADASEPSANFHLGILCLERPFVATDAKAPALAGPWRQARGGCRSGGPMHSSGPGGGGESCADLPATADTAKRQYWTVLARLYGALDEDAIQQDILDKRLAALPLTKQAMGYEAVDDYRRAYETYSRGTPLVRGAVFALDAMLTAAGWPRGQPGAQGWRTTRWRTPTRTMPTSGTNARSYAQKRCGIACSGAPWPAHY